MKSKVIKAAIGIGIGVVVFFVVRAVAKKMFPAKKTANNNNVSFAGDSKQGIYKAMFYDENYRNDDGSKGATWIGYNESPIVGFWKKGMMAEGTQVTV